MRQEPVQGLREQKPVPALVEQGLRKREQEEEQLLEPAAVLVRQAQERVVPEEQLERGPAAALWQEPLVLLPATVSSRRALGRERVAVA